MEAGNLFGRLPSSDGEGIPVKRLSSMRVLIFICYFLLSERPTSMLPSWHKLLSLLLFTTLSTSRPPPPHPLPLTLPPTALKAANCDSKSDWSAPNFLKEDCFKSVQDIFLHDYRPYPKMKFNFYSGIFPPPPGSNMVQTPRRYTTSASRVPEWSHLFFEGV